jgi:ADP-ribose pyrophosphatase YjhB (NUDIX family)
MELLDANGLNEEQFLKQYDPGDYPRPSMTADIVVFTVADIQGDNYRKLPEKELRILLIRRAWHPHIGQWALPGGFVNPDETVGEAANRELEEETGIRGGYLEQLYTFSKPGRDPRAWVVSCAHMALIDSGQLTLKAGSDASDARWFKVTAEEKSGMDKLTLANEHIRLGAYVTQESYGMERKVEDNDGLAFDHAEMIACAIGRLRAKIENTDLAFRLMPERFTLTQLQQVYEAILGKPLYKAAFRRRVMEYVSETGQYTQDAGHRPSQLFMRRRISRYT